MNVKLDAKPEELRAKFLALKTREDIALLLDTTDKTLIYYLYRLPANKKYTIFQIPKKSGGTREISAPISPIKIIQFKLKQVLETVYKPLAPVHGFVINHSIMSNVEAHLARKRRYVLNIDLKDFFPSINFGRVRGLFMAYPYNLPDPVATVLAQICCFHNSLPQGAPTSPIISNMICAKLDYQLLQLAKAHLCTYTRYADDMTFSTGMRNFPSNIAYTHPQLTGEQLALSPTLTDIIESNGFKVNPSKIRLQTEKMRQEITGITVNEFPNIQQKYKKEIRAMLHAWQKYGLEKAEEVFRAKYTKKHRSEYNQLNHPVSFKAVLRGKIGFLGMVRGQNDFLFSRLKYQYRRLSGGLLDTEPIVFISYSRKNIDFASKLVVSLSTVGINAWHDAKDILPSMDWDDTIDVGLRTCKGIIVIITPDSMKSENVKQEWQFYLHEKKPIVPILLEETPQKDIHYRLKALQHIDFCSSDYNTQFENLLKTLKRRKIIA